MHFTDEDKKHILHNALYSVAAVADKDYQRKIWVLGEGPEWNDFDETVNNLDLAKTVLDEPDEYGLTDHQCVLLKAFLAELDEFPYDTECFFYPDLVIETPKWARLIEMAKDVIKAFNWKNTTNFGPLQEGRQSQNEKLKLSDKAIYNALDFVLFSVATVADKERQRKEWFGKTVLPGGGEVDINRFDQVSNSLDISRTVLENRDAYGLADREHQCLVLEAFLDEFELFALSIGSNCSPANFIDTPEWTRLTEMAKGVLKAFNWKNTTNSGPL